MAEQLGLDELRAHALDNIGTARIQSGDLGGLQDFEDSIAIALRANAPAEVCRAQNNLAAMLWEQGQLVRAKTVSDEAAQAASRFGQVAFGRWFRAIEIVRQYALGHWQEAAGAADDFIAEVEAGSPHYLASGCYLVRAEIRLSRDELSTALADAERALELARLAKDPQNLDQRAAKLTHVFYEIGMVDRAAELADELLPKLRAGRDAGAGIDALHMLAWTLTALGRGKELLDFLPRRDSGWVRAAMELATGRLREAADICASMGAAVDAAHDRLSLAETLVKQARRAEADTELHRALDFYRSVGATRYIRRGEVLLAASA